MRVLLPATPQSKSGPDSTFIIDAALSLLALPYYNDDFNQPNKKTCSINGVVLLSTTDFAGASPQVESVSLKTNVIYYPNESVAPAIPPAPSNLIVTAANGEALLSWAATAGAASYNIYRSTAAGTEVLVKAAVPTANYSDTTLTNGTVYYYQVTGANVAGKVPNLSRPVRCRTIETSGCVSLIDGWPILAVLWAGARPCPWQVAHPFRQFAGTGRGF